MGWVVVIADSSMVVAESPPKADKQQSAVLIKGRGTEVAFTLDENAPLDEVAQELDSQLAGQSMLFSKGGISINHRQPPPERRRGRGNPPYLPRKIRAENRQIRFRGWNAGRRAARPGRHVAGR